MEVRIKQYWYNIKNSLWFLPSVMAISSVILAVVFLKIDHSISYDDFPIPWFVYGGQLEGARSVLSTIAASMVTISGVTFSITLVALTMASSQFGPRLLRNFIADKGNQFVIGTLISTFIYSLIILLAMRGSDDEEFIPKISVIFAFILAIFSLGVIIFFIHHVTKSIQADFVIKASFEEFVDLATTFEDKAEKSDPIHYDAALALVRNEYKQTTKIYFDKSGYIQSLDYDNSCSWAQKNSLVVEWLVYPGLYATVHDLFAVIHHKTPSPENAARQLQNFIVIAYQRTPNQDLLFSLKQIVEVGVRALSPGINDPNTAATCINWLGAALTEIARTNINTPVLSDENNLVRVLRREISFQMIVDTCFDHLQLYAKSNMYITLELLNAIEKPVIHTTNTEFRQSLVEKANYIYTESKKEFGQALLPSIDRQYQKIISHT